MRLLALSLALALANAATIPKTSQPISERKLTEIKEVKDQTSLDNVSSDQEIIDQSNLTKDVDNSLKKAPAAPSIPVQVVVEPAQVKSDIKKVQLNEVGIDSDDTSNIKRLEVDLKNPGPPQRVEHDTQNPEHFDDGQTKLDNVDVKQSIIDTENTFNGNAQNIQQTIQNWMAMANNQQIAAIQKNLQTMKQSVEAQINRMNQTIHKYWAPTAANIQSVAEGTKMNIQAGLKTLQSNVQSGMKVLTEEIKAIGSGKPEGSVKAEGEQPADNNQWYQGFLQQWNAFTQSMQQQLANITQGLNQQNQQNNQNNQDNSETNIFTNIQQGWQGLFNQGPPNAQSDENGGSQKPPTNPILQGLQNIQNFFQGPSPPGSVENDPVQPNSPAKPSNPIMQAIQNNPLIQGVQNIMRPPAPASSAPAPAAPPKPDAAAAPDAGSNTVPEKPAEPEKQEKPEVQPVLLNQGGPIQQMIEKNPIVQGLAGAVQRIQHNIRPTSPREADTQKGHFHKPGLSSNSDPDRVNGGLAAVVRKEEKKPEPAQKEPQPEKPQNKPTEGATDVTKKTK